MRTKQISRIYYFIKESFNTICLEGQNEHICPIHYTRNQPGINNLKNRKKQDTFWKKVDKLND